MAGLKRALPTDPRRRNEGKVKRIHHIGVVVADADAVASMLERALGLQVSQIEEYGQGESRIVFLPVGETAIELIQPLSPDSEAARYLTEHGPGIQHVALEVDELEAAMDRARHSGAQLKDDHPRPGAGGTRIAFLDAESLGGFMVELCEVLNDC
jgi:methylmalonyl-CoA epimerase